MKRERKDQAESDFFALKPWKASENPERNETSFSVFVHRHLLVQNLLLFAYQREQLGYENALTLLSSISRDFHVDGLRDKGKET